MHQQRLEKVAVVALDVDVDAAVAADVAAIKCFVVFTTLLLSPPLFHRVGRCSGAGRWLTTNAHLTPTPPT